MPLEDHYRGDDAWQTFCDGFTKIWPYVTDKDQLIEGLGGSKDFAMAVSGTMCDPLAWIHKAVPALDGLTPTECTRTEWGVKRLRECLMKMA